MVERQGGIRRLLVERPGSTYIVEKLATWTRSKAPGPSEMAGILSYLTP